MAPLPIDDMSSEVVCHLCRKYVTEYHCCTHGQVQVRMEGWVEGRTGNDGFSKREVFTFSEEYDGCRCWAMEDCDDIRPLHCCSGTRLQVQRGNVDFFSIFKYSKSHNETRVHPEGVPKHKKVHKAKKKQKSKNGQRN